MRSGVPGNRPPGVGSRGNDAEVSGKLVPFCAPFNMALAAVEALYRRPTLRLDCHASMGEENSSDRPKAGTRGMPCTNCGWVHSLPGGRSRKTLRPGNLGLEYFGKKTDGYLPDPLAPRA